MFPIAFACAETGEQKKRDWLIICIILSVLVDLIVSSKSTYVVIHILDRGIFFSCFLSSAAHMECGEMLSCNLHIKHTHLDTEINNLCTKPR